MVHLNPIASNLQFMPIPHAAASGMNPTSGLISCLNVWVKEERQFEAAKSQKRSNREIRKPKAEKPKALPTLPGSPVGDLLKKPKGKQ